VLNLQAPDSTDMGLSFFVFHEKTGLHVCASNLSYCLLLLWD